VGCCSAGGEILVFPPSSDARSDEPREEEEKPLDLPVVSSFDDSLREGPVPNLPRPWVARVPEDEVHAAIVELEGRDDVAVACPNWTVSPAANRTGELEPGASAAFLARYGLHPTPPWAGGGLNIAVVDSGVDEALLGATLAGQQIDFTRSGAAIATPPYDDIGHGSLVASLIHELAPAASISSIRCVGRNGAVLSDVVYSLLYLRLLPWPIHLVNLSLSVGAATHVCPECQYQWPEMLDAREKLSRLMLELRRALDPGCPIFVAAAGTESRLAVPAALPEVIAVACATDLAPVRTERSYGGGEDFVLAPGGSKWQPVSPGFYGSSFATAVATGLLAQNSSGICEILHSTTRERPAVERRFLASRAERGFAGYSAAEHGLGFLG
jgi:subtilisin family serine protease